MTKDNQSNKKAPGIINRKPPTSKKLKAMDLVKEMTAKGLLKDEPEAFKSQLEEISTWPDDAIDSMRSVVASQKT
jgi:hypothetical protein